MKNIAAIRGEWGSSVFAARSVRWLLSAVITVIALIGGALAVPSVAHADAATGSGGLFSAAQGRLFTSSQYLTPNAWTTIKVQGVAGIPTSGVAAVQVAYITYSATADGKLYAGKSGSTPSTDVASALYTKAPATTVSIVPVGADGSIQVSTTTSTSLAVDVQGYYTSGTPAAGGFNAVDSNRLNTVPSNTVYSPGQSVTFGLGGAIPANAGAVVLNVLAFPQDDTSGGWVRASTPGSNDGAQLNWPAGKDYNWTTIVQTPSSAGGKAQITVGPRGSVKLAVAVIGYYAAASTTWKNGTFVPGQATVVDTVTNGGGIAADGTKTIQVAGVNGVPPVGSGIQYVAASIRLYPKASGGEQTFASDASPEMSSASFTANQPISAFTMVPLGPDGAIKIHNKSAGVLDVGVDIQGWFSSLGEGPRSGNKTGSRTSATNLPFPVSDQTSAQVDVGTGNLQLSISALTLPGVTDSVAIGAAYNSRGWQTAVDSLPTANRWNWGLDAAGDLTANGSGVIWTDGTGAAWQFKPSGNNDGIYTSPAGLQMTLTLTNSGYTLKSWTSNQTINFDLNGNATSVVDRNKNQVTINRNGANLTSIVATAGPSAARTLNAKYENNTFTLTQANGSSTRSVSFTKDSAGNLTSYTDATGKTTTFTYSGSDLTQVTAPEGGVTTFTYDTTDRVTQVQQQNTTAGSPGTAVTRFSYVSDTTTQVADPRSDQSATVAAAKHTEYTLDANDLVTKTVDAIGRERSKTYNPASNGTLTSQVGKTGDPGTGTTTNKYDKNNNQSLTQSTSGSGSSSTADYGTGSAAYLPSKVTSSSGSSSSAEYDTAGNQTSQTGIVGSKATLEYNSDGTVKSATAPGNGPSGSTPAKQTTYQYNADKQLSSITAPANTVGTKNYTYDAFGRMSTETDGRGNTTTFGYDNDDRLTSTAFSDGTTTVTNAYDGNGNQTSQTSATGTITNRYDQRNRLISTVNTAGGGTVAYGYDLAGNTAKVTDTTGTVTHDYDASETLTATTYPTASGTAQQLYTTDKNGRRTDTWLAAVANADPMKDPTSWQAHRKLTYDKSGKVTQVQAWAANESPQLVVDVSYCYLATTTAPTCTATDANDRDQLQWSRDNITGQVTNYGYKAPDGTATDRLTGVTQSGGSTPTNWAYTYDAAGNRTAAKATNPTTQATISDQALSYNAIGQITTAGYSYDGTGNLTASPGQTFTYNGAQQMTSSTKDGVTTNYEYAGADMNKLLYQATDGGAEYGYTYGTTDSNGVPVVANRETIGTGTTSILSDPTNGRPLDLRTMDGVTSMYVMNGVGNPAAAITATGKTAYTVSYDPYGTEKVISGGSSAQWQQNPYGFKSGLRSSSTGNGLTKFGYRWQSNVTGGWIERDTLDAPLDPDNANRYAYAGADPINKSDPSGQDVFDSATDAFGKAGLVGDLAEIGYYAYKGNSKAAATKTVGLITGTLAGSACELGIAAATGGVGVIATGGCYAVGSAVSNVTTGEVF